MKKFLAVALATAIASTLTFAQTPVYNNGTNFTSYKLTEVKHRRKHKRHKHRKVSASV
jgi:hypothetical protein